MSSLFIVTSAIYTSYGKCSTKERIQQTKETLKSIYTHAPNSSVVLVDCGEKSVDENMFDCEIIDYTKNKKIRIETQKFLFSTKDIYPEIILKSMLEIMMFGDYLKSLTSTKYDRIFKLNGRYKLNSKFDYQSHLNSKNKVVTLPPLLSGLFYSLESGPTMFMYSTRCWSFDTNLLHELIKVFDKMQENILYFARTNKQGDIEHLFYKHLKRKYMHYINPIGVEGYWAPDGNLIME